MGPQSLSSRCASSDTPSAIGAFFIISSSLSGQCVQGSSRKMCVSWSNFEIFMFSWLTRFSSCRLFVSVLDAFQNDMRYAFKLLTFHADQDAKGFRLSISRVTKCEQRRHSPRLILLLHWDTVRSSSMLQKYYENGVIVFYVERIFRMCVTDICLEKRQIPHEDKILNPQ